MTNLHTIQQRLFQLLIIFGAWYLFYVVWAHPELQLAGPVILWLISYGAERLHDFRQWLKVRQRLATHDQAPQTMHAKAGAHPVFS